MHECPQGQEVSLLHLGTLGPDLRFIGRPCSNEEGSEHSKPSPRTPHFGQGLELAPRNNYSPPASLGLKRETDLRGAVQGRHWESKSAGRARGKGKRADQEHAGAGAGGEALAPGMSTTKGRVDHQHLHLLLLPPTRI